MNWKIPLADVDIGKEEIRAVTAVLESKWLTMGDVTKRFETAFSERLGVKHAFAVANGTAALHLAHQAVGISSGDEVICPSLTFVATANSILYTGGRPVFADVAGPDDLNVSAADIAARVTERTRAITVVHYGGYLCDMEEINRIASDRGLSVVEDAAHAPGSSLGGRQAGTLGTVGCFSFFPNKNLVVGEGGMVVTDDDEVAEKVRLLRSHGMTTLTWDRHKGHASSYDVVDLGYNYRIDEMRSAIGLVQLSKLDENNSRRRELVERYVRLLEEVEEVTVPFADRIAESACHIAPVLLAPGIDRAAVRAALQEKGIQSSVHYPPVHLLSHYRKTFGFSSGMLPQTEDLSAREVTLPLYPRMGFDAVDAVVAALKNAVRSSISPG